MSEYVIDATDAQLGDAFDARAFFGPRLREEIVRCRDCQLWDPRGWCMWCGREKMASGFCDRGVRRAG